MLAQKANHIDNIIEKRDSLSLCYQNVEKSLDASAGDPIAYTRTLDKAYYFFQDGHVQNVRYHPMPTQPDFVCISASNSSGCWSAIPFIYFVKFWSFFHHKQLITNLVGWASTFLLLG